MGHVLVTDGSQRSTLALVRSLGKKGIKVTVGEDSTPCLASVSKYAYESFQYPSPADNPDGFIADLKRKVESGTYDVLIPMTDVTSYLIGMHQQELSEHVRIPMVDKETFEKASDKAETVRLAQQLDVPVPQTHFVEDPKHLENLARDMHYPVVIKPHRSRYQTDAGWIGTRVGFANSSQELTEYFNRLNLSQPLPMIQERINGDGCGAFFLFDHGRPLAVFFHRRLREKPPSGGVSVLRESIPVDPQMRRDAEKLLSALNWHGVAMVEFKKDNRDNQYKLMEINARFWGSLQLAIDAGVDFPYLIYQIATGGAPEPVTEYRVGVKTRWLLGDLDHLLIRLFKSDRKLNLPNSHPGRAATIFNFLKLWQANTRYEIFKLNDFRPALHETGQYIKTMLGMSR